MGQEDETYKGMVSNGCHNMKSETDLYHNTYLECSRPHRLVSLQLKPFPGHLCPRCCRWPWMEHIPAGCTSLAIGHAHDRRICQNRGNHRDCSVNLDQLVSESGAAAAAAAACRGQHQEEDSQNVQCFSFKHD